MGHPRPPARRCAWKCWARLLQGLYALSTNCGAGVPACFSLRRRPDTRTTSLQRFSLGHRRVAGVAGVAAANLGDLDDHSVLGAGKRDGVDERLAAIEKLDRL